MKPSQSFVTFVVEQLGRSLPNVRAQRTFGFIGLYVDRLIFGLIAEERLYFKVDASNRPAYVSAGMARLHAGPRKSAEGGYYEVPAEVLEDPALLGEWAQGALAAASAKAVNRRKRAR